MVRLLAPSQLSSAFQPHALTYRRHARTHSCAPSCQTDLRCSPPALCTPATAGSTTVVISEAQVGRWAGWWMGAC